jgi:hypothetical protein
MIKNTVDEIYKIMATVLGLIPHHPDIGMRKESGLL